MIKIFSKCRQFFRWFLLRCPKWVLFSYVSFVWLNIALLIASSIVRYNKYEPLLGSSDSIAKIFPFPTTRFRFYDEYESFHVIPTEIGLYDWTEFLAYLVLPLLCIITCILLSEKIDKVKNITSQDINSDC